MNPRLVFYDWLRHYRLDAETGRRLYELAGLEREPEHVRAHFLRGLALAAAGLAGLGLVFWVAANWESFGRLGRSLLLQALLLASGIGAWRFPAARAALAGLMCLGVGALLAVFGQTYQTGADPWQLFALWAALTLPLALAAQNDAVWSIWALVAQTAVLLWSKTWLGDAAEPWPVLRTAAAWGCSALILLGLAPRLRRLTGAGIVSFRLALTLAAALPVVQGIVDLFDLHRVWEDHSYRIYALALLWCAAAAAVFGRPRRLELYGLSLAVLALDVLLVAGLMRLPRGTLDLEVFVLLLGLAAALLLAAGVSAIVYLQRRAGEIHHA